MATVIICRRLPGRVRSVAAFSFTPKCETRRKMPQRRQKEDESHEVSDKDAKAAASVRLPNPLEIRAHYNLSPYEGTKAASCQNGARNCEDSEEPLENEFSSIGVRQVRDPYSGTSSQSLSSAKNSLLDLGFHETLSTKANSLEPMEDKLEDTDMEVFDSMKDLRTFQKHRTEYLSLSYDKFKTLQVLPIEDGQWILHKLTTLQHKALPGTIVEYFCKLSHLPAKQHVIVKSHARFIMLCEYGVKNIQRFSTSELIDILKAFVRLSIPPAHSMLDVYENEFCRQIWGMSLDQVLLVADLWRCLEHSVPHYLQSLFSYVNLHWEKLTLPQLVQLIYIIGEGRVVPQVLMQKLETLVWKYLDSFNLEEVGTVCLGFFKSRSAFSEHIMRKIGDRASAQMADIKNHALVNMLKMFRYTRVFHVDFLEQLRKVIPPRIRTMTIQGVMHVTLTCSALRYLSEEIMNTVASLLPSRVMDCRSKDVAKFLWSFGVLNYKPPNAERFYSSLIEEMQRNMCEFKQYPEHFLTCLLGLAFAERFPTGLINYALSVEFIALLKESKFDLRKDLLSLDGSVAIECPDYKGNRLSLQFQEEVTNMLVNIVKTEIHIRPEMEEAVVALEVMLGGPQYVKHHMILPHTRTDDVEVHFGADRKPLPFNLEADRAAKGELQNVEVSLTDDLMNQLLKKKSSGESPLDNKTQAETCSQAEAVEQKQVPPTGNHSALPDTASVTSTILNTSTKSETAPTNFPSQLKPQFSVVKLAIQVSQRADYCYASKQLLGMHSLKRRQLQKLGFLVVELPYWEWIPLLKKPHPEKLRYLHHKVYSVL